MKLTAELLKKAKTAQSAEELLELAKAEGIDLTPEQADEAFTKLQPPLGELTDEELENVAGGGCGGSPTPQKTQYVGKQLDWRCPPVRL